MEKKVCEKPGKDSILYVFVRLLTLATVVLLFFPSLSPVNFITQAGQAKIKGTASLFTSGISYSSLTSGLDRAFRMGWLNETYFYILFLESAQHLQ